MVEKYIPINKGNYSMDTQERECLFDAYRAEGWEQEYELYRKNWVDFPKKQYVSEYPLLVDLELSSLCNLHCPMCYTITDEFKKKVNTTLMSWDLYTKIIDEISGKVPAIRLSLRGEAFLHPKFIDCISYAKKKGIGEVSTLTNGSRLSSAFSEAIIDAGIDWITISVDGVGEVYEKIRTPIKFDELVEKISLIKELKKQKGMHRPVVKVQGIWPAVKQDIDEYYRIFQPIADLVAFNPLIDYLGNDSDIDYLENFSCPQQYQRLVIGADGLAMKCSNDEENIEILGDLKRETVYQVWHGEKMKQERNRQHQHGFMESEVCRNCYLPRKTQDEDAFVDGRHFIVKNYTNRSQLIGK
ncbi:MAG: radical SAM/SPASM domain-containing protein [Candidatus Electrothrix sp. EH2]|nr:radical SAM/SPASM domain-containing protein [Candidatus Electrothrix sp. EH2]